MTQSIDRPRYFGLDCVRATAMLLGVVYHTILFWMFVAPPAGLPDRGGPPGMSGVSDWLMDWSHCFRMPLFFVISGFFSAMMFEKYGVAKYIGRRWSRIGLPLVIGLFTFGPVYILTRDAVTSGPNGMGGMPPGPPPAGGPGGPGVPRFGPGGPPPMGGPNGMPSAPGRPGAGANAMPGGGPPGMGPGFGESGRASEQLFGSSDRYFHLNHLWFLWYLLIFVTLVPPVVWCAAQIVRRALPHRTAEWAGRVLAGPVVFPVVLGVVGIPALDATAGPFGWGLGLAPAIFRGFPDFLWRFDADMAFYAMDFVAGWWFFHQRAGLPALARWWLLNLAVGIAAFATAAWLRPERGPPDPGTVPRSDSVRLMGLALYSLGSAFTAVGFIGVFQRFLNRPTRTGRYLADTALWVYLAHQPLVIVGLAIVGPLGLPWWARTVLVSFGAVIVGLLLFEAIVRPTPLMRVFGPARRGVSEHARVEERVQPERNSYQVNLSV